MQQYSNYLAIVATMHASSKFVWLLLLQLGQFTHSKVIGDPDEPDIGEGELIFAQPVS